MYAAAAARVNEAPRCRSPRSSARAPRPRAAPPDLPPRARGRWHVASGGQVRGTVSFRGNREKNTPGGAASNGVSGRCVGGPRPQQQPAATAELEGLFWQSIMDSTTPAGFKRLRLGRGDAG